MVEEAEIKGAVVSGGHASRSGGVVDGVRPFVEVDVFQKLPVGVDTGDP